MPVPYLKRMLPKLTLVLLSSILAFASTEIGMRYILKDFLSLHQDERNLTYSYDIELGWFPVSNSKKKYTGSRTITAEHNSRGFRDSEHTISGNPSILFLGDSFVWGYDVEKDERFTEKLSLRLPEWSIYNLGVSGYGTDQELILLSQQYDYYKPDIVFILFCTENDEFDNTHNVVYGGYYKPYFTLGQGKLQLQGVPVPKSENYYLAKHDILAKFYWFRLLTKTYLKLKSPPSLELENPTPALLKSIHDLVKNRGAELIVGSTGSHPELAKFLAAWQIGYIDLSNSYRYPSQGMHWTPAGHSVVCEKIFDFLKQRGHLKAVRTRKTRR